MAAALRASALCRVNSDGAQLDLWYIRDKPKPGESLTSWITRLAWNHGLKYQNFCYQNWGRASTAEHGDLDRRAPEIVLDVLEKRTGASRAQIVGTTLASFTGTLFEALYTRGHVIGLYSRAACVRPIRLRYRLQFCPACLASDETPFSRLSWRLSFLVCCPKHGLVLSDGCARCSAPYAPTRFGKQRPLLSTAARSPFTHCWNCGCDLRRRRSWRATAAERIFVQRITEAIADGGTYLSDRPIHALAYVGGIRMLITLLTRGRRGDRIARVLERNSLLVPRCDGRPVEFDEAHVSTRRWIVRAIEHLLSSWPVNYVETLLASKVSSSYVFDLNQRNTIEFRFGWPSLLVCICIRRRISRVAKKLQTHERCCWLKGSRPTLRLRNYCRNPG
jgi:hypothetical protein